VLTDFTARLVQFRKDHTVFRRRRFFNGRQVRGSDLQDIGWFQPGGEPMTDDDWESGSAKSLTVFLNGDGIREPDARGEPVSDDSFFLLFNGFYQPLDFTLPSFDAERWKVVIDTNAPLLDQAEERSMKSGETFAVESRTILVLQKLF
jgi:isoamylase